MQILDIPSLNQKEHTIETFLISTKGNDANWKIDKETGHEKVKSFIGKDFSIIPELLFRPLEQGGGGHVFGPRDYVLKKYADNSKGKIVELRGPIYEYVDPSSDYYYNAIIKLNDSRAASSLLEHGNNTWVPFAVSPHIFINEEGGGNDEVGWKDWSGAALALVIKGAYGNEAVISKLCNGPHKACKMELAQQRTASDQLKFNDDFTSALISSLVSKTASLSSNTDMVDNVSKLSTEPPSEPAPEGEKPNGGGEGSDQQQSTMKIIKDTEVIKPVEQINISADELNQLRETQKQFKEMQNERRDEILKEIFAGVEDEAARKELIKEYSKNDLAATKALKTFYDKVSPLVASATRKSIEMELQQRKEEEAKKTKVNSNGRSASVTQLRAEPKVEKEEESRAASSSKVDEVALLKKFMANGGNF